MVLRGPRRFFVDTSLGTYVALFLPEGESWHTVADVIDKAVSAHRTLFAEHGFVEAAELFMYGTEVHLYGCDNARRYGMIPCFDAGVLAGAEHIYIVMKQPAGGQAKMLQPTAATAPLLLTSGEGIGARSGHVGAVEGVDEGLEESSEEEEHREVLLEDVVRGDTVDEECGKGGGMRVQQKGADDVKAGVGEIKQRVDMEEDETTELSGEDADVSVVEDSVIEETEGEEDQEQIPAQQDSAVNHKNVETVGGSVVRETSVTEEGGDNAQRGGAAALHTIVEISPPRTAQPANTPAKETPSRKASAPKPIRNGEKEKFSNVPASKLTPKSRKTAVVDGPGVGAGGFSAVENAAAVDTAGANGGGVVSPGKKPPRTYGEPTEGKEAWTRTAGVAEEAVVTPNESGHKYQMDKKIETIRAGTDWKALIASVLSPIKRSKNDDDQSKKMEKQEREQAEMEAAIEDGEGDAVTGMMTQSAPAKQPKKRAVKSKARTEADAIAADEEAVLVGQGDAVTGLPSQWKPEFKQPKKRGFKSKAEKLAEAAATEEAAVQAGEGDALTGVMTQSAPAKQPKKRSPKSKAENVEEAAATEGAAVEAGEGDALIGVMTQSAPAKQPKKRGPKPNAEKVGEAKAAEEAAHQVENGDALTALMTQSAPAKQLKKRSRKSTAGTEADAIAAKEATVVAGEENPATGMPAQWTPEFKQPKKRGPKSYAENVAEAAAAAIEEAAFEDDGEGDALTGVMTQSAPSKQPVKRGSKSKAEKVAEGDATKEAAVEAEGGDAVTGVPAQWTPEFVQPRKRGPKSKAEKDAEATAAENAAVVAGEGDALTGVMTQSAPAKRLKKRSPKSKAENTAEFTATKDVELGGSGRVVEAEAPMTPVEQPEIRDRDSKIETDTNAAAVAAANKATAQPDAKGATAAGMQPNTRVPKSSADKEVAKDAKASMEIAGTAVGAGNKDALNGMQTLASPGKQTKKRPRKSSAELEVQASTEHGVAWGAPAQSVPRKQLVKQGHKSKAEEAARDGAGEEADGQDIHRDPFAFPHSPQHSITAGNQTSQKGIQKVKAYVATPEAVVPKPKVVPTAVRALSSYKAAYPLVMATPTKRQKIAKMYQFYDY